MQLLSLSPTRITVRLSLHITIKPPVGLSLSNTHSKFASLRSTLFQNTVVSSEADTGVSLRYPKITQCYGPPFLPSCITFKR